MWVHRVHRLVSALAKHSMQRFLYQAHCACVDASEEEIVLVTFSTKNDTQISE